jgi:hypothetical protein
MAALIIAAWRDDRCSGVAFVAVPRSTELDLVIGSGFQRSKDVPTEHLLVSAVPRLSSQGDLR